MIVPGTLVVARHPRVPVYPYPEQVYSPDVFTMTADDIAIIIATWDDHMICILLHDKVGWVWHGALSRQADVVPFPS